MLIGTNLDQAFFLLFRFSYVTLWHIKRLKNYIIIIFELFPSMKHTGTDYFRLALSMLGIFLQPLIIFQGNSCDATEIPVVSGPYKFVSFFQGPECHGSWRGQQAALPSLGQWPR